MSPYDATEEAKKLLRVRDAIEAILRREDICANVQLAGRAHMEVFMHLDASWSNAQRVDLPDGAAAVRLLSRKADYGGDVDAQKRDLQFTVGMVRGFAEVISGAAVGWLGVARHFDEATNAEHEPTKPSFPPPHGVTQ